MKVLAFLAAAYVALLSPTLASAGMLAQAQQYKGLHEIKNNKTLRAALGINPAELPEDQVLRHHRDLRRQHQCREHQQEQDAAPRELEPREAEGDQ